MFVKRLTNSLHFRCEKDILDNVNLNKIVEQWASHRRRKISKFTISRNFIIWLNKVSPSYKIRIALLSESEILSFKPPPPPPPPPKKNISQFTSLQEMAISDMFSIMQH